MESPTRTWLVAGACLLAVALAATLWAVLGCPFGVGLACGESGTSPGTPPGVTDGRLTDPGALYAAHLEALNATAYRATADVAGANAELSALNVTANGTAAVVTLRTNDATVGVYRRDGATLRRVDPESPGRPGPGSATRFAYARDAPDTFDAVGRLFVERRFLAAALSAGAFRVVGRVTRDGRTLVRMRATGVANASAGNTAITDVNATMLVTTEGLIRRFEGSVTQRSGDTTERVSLSYAVRRPATVESPSWSANVTRIGARVLDGGRVVAVTHRGGPGLPPVAGVRLGRPPTAAGSLGVALSAGETVYLHANETGALRVVPERSAVPAGTPRLVTGPTVITVAAARQRASVRATAPANGTARGSPASRPGRGLR